MQRETRSEENREDGWQNPSWYQAALRQKSGRVTAADMTKEVNFEPVSGPTNDLIDDAYRAKYRGRSVSRTDDRRRRPLGNYQDHAAQAE